jgi:hypothetical protein
MHWASEQRDDDTGDRRRGGVCAEHGPIFGRPGGRGRGRRGLPEHPAAARENRGFLRRAVNFLAGESGISKFLDIGTGLPTADNTHEVAQRSAPDARAVYVDNDR